MASVRPRAIPLRELRTVVRTERARFFRFAVITEPRPHTRADCLPGGCNEARPCPFLSCRHHAYLDVVEQTGSLKLNFPNVPPDELHRLPHTCTLDAADAGPQTLEDIGAALNLTRERVRQIENRVFEDVKRKMRRHY